MRLLRTAAGEFINATAIARLQRDGDGVGWLAILADGAEILLAPLPDPAAACRAEACCAG